MKIVTLFPVRIFILLGLFALPLQAQAAPKRVTWVKYDEAFTKAREERKTIMLIFGASWCQACERFQSETLTSKYVIEKSQETINVMVDGEERPDLSHKHRITAYPQIIFIAYTGTQVYKRTGFLETGEFLPKYSEALEKASAETKEFEKVENLWNQEPENFNNTLAYINALFGYEWHDLAPAVLKKFKKSSSSQAESNSDQLMLLGARVLAYNGKSKKAISPLKKFIKNNPDSSSLPEARFRLAEAYAVPDASKADLKKANGFFQDFLGDDTMKAWHDQSEFFLTEIPIRLLSPCLVVTSVNANSIAERIGIQPDDVVFMFNKRRIKKHADLVMVRESLPSSKEAPMVLMRRGQKITIQAPGGKLGYNTQSR